MASSISIANIAMSVRCSVGQCDQTKRKDKQNSIEFRMSARECSMNSIRIPKSIWSRCVHFSIGFSCILLALIERILIPYDMDAVLCKQFSIFSFFIGSFYLHHSIAVAIAPVIDAYHYTNIYWALQCK